MFYLVTEMDGNTNKVVYTNEEEVCIAFFREVSKIINKGYHDKKVVIENYSCDFGNMKLYVEPIKNGYEEYSL